MFIPVVLFKLVCALKPKKPAKEAIKWGLIAGTVYVFVFWLTNTAQWVKTVIRQGTDYLIFYPQNLFSFAITSIGLLLLTVFMAYYAKKFIGAETLEKLDLQPIGAITVALGLFYFWNYLSWHYFGIDEIWSNWYAWFLGINLNLWMLSIPLVGLPLLFISKSVPTRLSQNSGKLLYLTQVVGAIFVAVFLGAYLGGLPSRNVLHSEPIFKIPLMFFGSALLIFIIAAVVVVTTHKTK